MPLLRSKNMMLEKQIKRKEKKKKAGMGSGVVSFN